MASKSVDKRLAAQGENRDFATVLREWWSFDNHQRHTHSWHTREDFIDKELPKLLDDVRAQDANRYGYTHLSKPDDTHVRESLAGDGEAITEEWLRGVGFMPQGRERDLFLVMPKYDDRVSRICVCFAGGYLPGFYIEESDGGCESSVFLPHITTRRQLLSLLSALGIEKVKSKGEPSWSMVLRSRRSSMKRMND